MAVVATTTYLYCDANLNQIYVQGTALTDRGPWSSSASYIVLDVVQIGLDQYIAIAPNTNAPPTGIVDENWSQLVIVEENAGSVQPGVDLVARALGSEALALGTAAYDLAQTGSNTAWVAWELAQTGTNLIVIEAGSRIAADAALAAFVFGSIGVDLVAETGSRIAADAALQTEIVIETGSRVAADAAIVAFVFGSIAVDLAAETGSRIAADAALTAFVFGSIGTDLDAEKITRAAADQQIITIVETGTNVAYAAYALAQTGTVAVQTEQGTRSSADQDLQNQIVALSGSTSGSISSGLAAEAGTRSSQDQVLLTLILTEQGTRSSADQDLQTQITVTTDRAGAAYALAQIGTNVGSTAYSTAQAAYGVAQVGTAVASQGYGIAVSGSTTANQALALAQTLNLIVSAGSAGTNLFYVAQTANSDRSDVQITVVAGVLTNMVGSRFQYEDFDKYGLGVVGQGTGDLGLYTTWNGSAAIFNSDNTLMITGSDAYAATFYGTGTNTTGLYAGGRGWGNASGFIVLPFAMQVAFDTIQTYALGTVIPGQLSAGTGWGSAAILTQY